MTHPTPTTSAERGFDPDELERELESGAAILHGDESTCVAPSAERVAALEQWQCVVVEWIDSCGSGGWHQPEDHHTRAIHCVTCGLLYSQNEDALTVVLSRDLDNGNVSGLITIPKLAVTLLRPIATLDEHA